MLWDYSAEACQISIILPLILWISTTTLRHFRRRSSIHSTFSPTATPSTKLWWMNLLKSSRTFWALSGSRLVSLRDGKSALHWRRTGSHWSSTCPRLVIQSFTSSKRCETYISLHRVRSGLCAMITITDLTTSDRSMNLNMRNSLLKAQFCVTDGKIWNLPSGEKLTGNVLGELAKKLLWMSTMHTVKNWKYSRDGLTRTSSHKIQTPCLMPLWLCHMDLLTRSTGISLMSRSPFPGFSISWELTRPRSPSSAGTIGEKFISPVLGIPQLVLPCQYFQCLSSSFFSFPGHNSGVNYWSSLVGQMPYQSRISGRLEHRPIGSTILGAKGSDLMLIKLAEAAFRAASWPTSVDVGRYMFPLADNVRNVALVEEPSKKQGLLQLQSLSSKF